ncbi:Wzy polymerase domain-containing protein [Serratia rubidaea]|uniref:PglL family O-oligosaccharyltransferase n=1 Tax=Serratia rubidaea TaxID=61652 RepID=UPI00234B4EBF|nr:Wzy polymerase domain-containing protein [Serratia rubidaea]MDC6118410.1 Wzy polymerase domain-containing protein [Serratia rubidaea]
MKVTHCTTAVLLYQRLPALVLCLWFVVVMHIYLPNGGGIGLNLPLNVLTWMAMAGVALVIWQCRPKNKYLTTTLAGRLFFIGAMLLFIPLAYTQPEWLAQAGWRLAGLAGGLLFYFTLSQYRMPLRFRRLLLQMMLCAVALQAALTLCQLFWPGLAQTWMDYVPGGRPYGIFQQPNVLGSFIAMGVALALMLWLQPQFRLSGRVAERWRSRLLAGLLLLLPAVQVWVQSRTGWLAGMAAAMLMLLTHRRSAPRRSVTAALLMALGAGLGLLALWQGLLAEQGLRYVSHAASNHARYTMLRDTLAMIAEKPWSGWGYGGFEFSFQHFRVHQAVPTAVTEIARHPHNELLLWWVEGGVVALAGVGLFIAGGIVLLRQTLRLAQGERRREAIALLLVLLPLLLHTQTEYPFYLSLPHWMAFLTLLAMLERRAMPVMRRRRLSPCWRMPLSRGIQVLALATLVMMAGALSGGYTLTLAERGGFRLMGEVDAMSWFSDWAYRDRRQFDRQMSSLLTFNQTGDEQRLQQYASWADRYLRRRVDVNVYATLIQILQYQQQDVPAEQQRREAALLFPKDTRFQPMTPDQGAL